MIVSIALVAAALCAIVLLGLLRRERRKPYNEFQRPVSTASAALIYGDTGGAGAISGGGMDGGCGGGGGDGGGC
jgi:hypothetical protein